jgi:uncharacterized protein involved in exopolysaccharide biosynthesis
MQNKTQQTASSEISLKDIVDFFKRNKWRIVIGGLAGLLLASAYVLVAPKKYEARWQLQMAQYMNCNTNTNTNSEEPAELVQRLRMPTSYSLDVRVSCGVQEDGDSKDYLDGNLKVEVVKNVANAVDMKIVAKSTDQAKKCAEEMVAMIVTQQHSLIEEHMAGRQEQLRQYQQALREEQQQLETIKRSEIGNFGYLAKLDKLSWLRTRIDALLVESSMSQMHPARLVQPIYVPNKPASPKVGLAFLFGALLGLMLGILYALGREGWRRAA